MGCSRRVIFSIISIFNVFLIDILKDCRMETAPFDCAVINWYFAVGKQSFGGINEFKMILKNYKEKYFWHIQYKYISWFIITNY